MAGWGEYLLVWLVFLVSHLLPSSKGMRARLIALMGRRLYFSIYGTVSLVLLVWMIVAAARAPYVEVWAAADWQRWLANIVVPLALWLAVMGIGIGYPHTLGGRRAQVFDVNNPGMAAITRHPVLWALALWSLVHMLANGDLAHVILFGGFLLMALLAMPVFDLRAQRVLSDAQWAEVRRVAPLLPHPAFGRLNRRNLAWRSATAVVIYLIAYQLHQPVIGVSPEIF